MPPLLRPLLLPPQPFPSHLPLPSLQLPRHRMTWSHALVVGKVSLAKNTGCQWHRHKRTLRPKRLQLRRRSLLTRKSRAHARMPAAVYSTSLEIRCQTRQYFIFAIHNELRANLLWPPLAVEQVQGEAPCCYHPGPPVFHDAAKKWGCCNKSRYQPQNTQFLRHVRNEVIGICSHDFDEWMKFPGCARGPHAS